MKELPVALRKVPFARLLIALLTGLVIEYSFLVSVTWLCGAMALLLVLLAGFLFLPMYLRYMLRWLQGVVILMCLVIAGGWGVWKNDIRNQRDWIGYRQEAPVCITVDEQPQEKENSIKAMAAVNMVSDSGNWQPASGRIYVYFRKDKAAEAVGYGTRLIITKKLQAVTGYGNPGGFDYAKYSALQQIYHQVYLQPGDYVVVGSGKGSRVQQWLYRVRDRVLAAIKLYIAQPQAAGLAEALLVGYRGDLDKELVNAYSVTGVVHIIAISGMHLAMIYGLLLGITGFGTGYTIMRVIRPLLLLTVIWLFTLLSGAAPSIMRSAVMFTFVIAGQLLVKKPDSLNSLAASAFCLLLYNPLYIADIGFQLSYAAVAGIVLFYQRLYQRLEWKNRLLDYVWQMTAVSLAAQVFTVPVILYHFHQFPFVFLFTNLVIVPLSGLILYLLLLLLCVTWWPYVAVWLGKITTACIQGMNGVVFHMQHLPFALAEGIAFSGWQAVLLLLAIITGAIACWLKNKRVAIAACSLLAAVLVLQGADSFRLKQQQKLVVYNVPHTSTLEMIYGNNSYWMGDTSVCRDNRLMRQFIIPSHVLWRVKESRITGRMLPVRIWQYGKKRIAQVLQPLAMMNKTGFPDVDILIVGGSAGNAIRRLALLFNCQQIVFDSSNPLWKIEKWKKDCEGLHLRFHSVPRDGAFVMEL